MLVLLETYSNVQRSGCVASIDDPEIIISLHAKITPTTNLISEPFFYVSGNSKHMLLIIKMALQTHLKPCDAVIARILTRSCNILISKQTALKNPAALFHEASVC